MSNLKILFPDISKQWHPIKNGYKKPEDFTTGSSKKVWWKCDKGDDHEWEASVNNRTFGQGCPVCSGNKVVISNCLATKYSKLAKQWHPTKNGKITPFDVTPNSNKKVWWKCDKDDDHDWR